MALVTGGNKGIGKEIAQGLLDRGHTVLLGCRSFQAGEQTARELTGTGKTSGSVASLLLDVTDADSIRTACTAVREKQGRLDILVSSNWPFAAAPSHSSG